MKYQGTTYPGRRRWTSILTLFAALWLACACTAPAGGAPAAQSETAASSGGSSANQGRGVDGDLTLLYWQAVSLLNPYLASGNKDYHAASLILEPLLWWDPDGNPVPALAADVPTLENGGISEDRTSITYALREGVLWSDGTPLTADDVVFTWQYCTNPDTPCTLAFNFDGVRSVEALDPLTVRITFDAPRPFPYGPFTGQVGVILQQAQFADCVGARAQECAAQNTGPIGTGPYRVTEFRANDTVVYAINEHYRIPDQPHFATVTIKGGGDAAGAAQAVLVTGEADWAWNLAVQPTILADMEKSGVGTIYRSNGGNVERILINFTNPDPALGEDRSNWKADGSTAHPFLSDLSVRQALSMAIDRTVIAEHLFGVTASPTCNVLAAPSSVVSTANDGCLVQDIDGAKALLDKAGWVDADGDGVREKDGLSLKVLFLTSENAVRKNIQDLVQQWWQQIGVATELKTVPGSVYFSGDPGSPDTYNKFYADVQLFAFNPDTTDPQSYLKSWVCGEDGENIARADNGFSGQNIERWCNPEYDALFATYEQTFDPDQRTQMAMQLNDMLAQQVVNIPLVARDDVSAGANSLAGVRMNSWDSQLWNIAEWRRVQ